jgi:uncharacterized membrane protein
MMAPALIWAKYAKPLKWLALALCACTLLGYMQHLRHSRDAALNTVQSLQTQLNNEHQLASAMAQAAADQAHQASSTAAAQLQSQRAQLGAANQQLKEEIKRVYQTTPSARPAAQTPNASNPEATQLVFFNPVAGDGVDDDRRCFGPEFERLWNAANTSTRGVPSPAAP